jgi:excisionase family DNA binding protein
MATAISPSELYTREEAATYLRIRPQTLAVWRTTHRYNLPCVKVGTRCLYRKSDLDRWLESRVVGGAESDQ